MSFDDVLQLVQKAFKPRKPVDFPELGLHFEMEPLTTAEEIKVLTSIKDFEGAEYTEALKRHTLALAIKQINDLKLDAENVKIIENGQEVIKSKFLFMVEYLNKWPSSFISEMFDAFSNIIIEVDDKIRKGMKFERYMLTEPPEPEKKGGLKKVEEKEEAPSDEVEKLNKTVEQEINQANANMAKAEAEAVK